MRDRGQMREAWLGLVLGASLVIAGCAPSRVPAPVENRTVQKPAPTTQQGAREIRASAVDSVPDGFYRVRKGDTLIGISLDHGVSWRDLAEWNSIANPNLIEVDQLVRVRPPSGAARIASAPATVPSAASSALSSQPSPAAAASGGVTEVKPIAPQAALASKPGPAVTPPQPAQQSASPQVASAATSAAPQSLSWPSSGRVITQFAEPGQKGIAFAGQEGDPVLAAGDGRVVYSGSGLRGYGNLVIVKHEGDFLTAYAHNRKILVNEGQAVKRGQQIAELGSTDSDIPKLHFEVRLSGKPVDPMRYLAQR